MKRRHLLLSAGLIGAASLVILGDQTTNGSSPAVAKAPASGTRGRTPSDRKNLPSAPHILLLQERALSIGEGDPGTPALASSNLFRSQSWAPPPPPPPVDSGQAAPPPPPPPQAPPLPFRYLGKKFEDGKWELYLAQGDDTLIVREHQPIDASYLVGAIEGPRLTITYVPLNQAQTLNIGGNGE